CQQGESNPFTF
nr:immunoglobulin light chain junction region [Macaca mulatta]